MCPILLILRFGVDFFPTGPIQSIDVYYNRIYILREDGLVVLNKTSHERIFSTPIDKGKLLIYDPEFGDLYILTERELLRYLEGSDHLTRIPLRGVRPRRIGVGKGYIYLETPAGYYRLRKGSFFFEKTGSVEVKRWQGGLSEERLHSYPILTPYYYTDNLLNKYPITALCQSGRYLYIGSRLGVEIVNLPSAHRRRLTLGPIDRVVRITDLDTLIAFISQNQISFYSPTADTWFYRSYLHDIVDITNFRNRIYLGTKNGLFTIQSGVTLPILRNPVITITRIGDLLYLYAGSKLSVITPSTDLPQEILTFTGTIRKIAIYNNRLYLGSDRGLFRLDTTEYQELIDPRGYLRFGVDDIIAGDKLYLIASGHLITYQDSFSYLPIGDGTALALGSDRIWVGTRSGLWYYQNGMVERSYLLPAIEIYSILSKGRYLWVATEKGLYRLRIG